MMKYFVLMLILGATLAACNTTRGFGEDVESVGEGIQKSVD